MDCKKVMAKKNEIKVLFVTIHIFFNRKKYFVTIDSWVFYLYYEKS